MSYLLSTPQYCITKLAIDGDISWKSKGAPLNSTIRSSSLLFSSMNLILVTLGEHKLANHQPTELHMGNQVLQQISQIKNGTFYPQFCNVWRQVILTFYKFQWKRHQRCMQHRGLLSIVVHCYQLLSVVVRCCPLFSSG